MKKWALGILFLCLGGTASAQDVEEEPAEEEAPWTPAISGFIDGTYNYNFNQPAGGLTPYHSYTGKHHTFLLNTAHLALAASNDNLGFVIELDAGTDAKLNSYTTGGELVDVQEAFLTYTSDGKIGFKAGKFVTTHGIEVIESPANPTISRGFLFNLAEPVNHVGALGTYKLSDTLDAALGVVNGWDVMVDNNAMKTILGKFGVTTDQFLLTLSMLAGPEQTGNNDDWRLTFDATGVYKMDKIDLWFQANSGMEQAGDDSVTWFGVGAQPIFKLSDMFALGTRLELFNDMDGARSGLKQMLVNVSAAPTYTVTDHLIMRAELRLDLSTGRDDGVDGPFIHKEDGAKDLQLVGLTEAIVTF